MLLRKRNNMCSVEHLCCKIEYVFVIVMFLSVSVKGFVQRKCDTKESIPLNCSRNQMIHVISELYGERTSQVDCIVKEVNSSSKLSRSDKCGLQVNCNGEETCTETTKGSIHSSGNYTALELEYDCVNDSKNMCSSFNQTSSLQSLYLHSPGFPNRTLRKRCECSVSGENLEVMVVEYRGPQCVLQINTTGDDYGPWPLHNGTYFNRMIAANMTNVNINYSNEEESNIKFWVKIEGDITASKCNMRESLLTSKTTPLEPPKTAQESTSSTTTPERTSTSTTTQKTSTRKTTGKQPTTTTTPKQLSTTTPEIISTVTTTEKKSTRKTTGKLTTSTTTPKQLSTTMSQQEESTTKGMTNSYETTTKTTKSESEFIILSGGISGGVVVFIIIISITCFLCRKRKASNVTDKKHEDVHTGYDVIDERKIIEFAHNANPNLCTTMNLRNSGFGETDLPHVNYNHITHTSVQAKVDIINEMKTFSLHRKANPNLCTTTNHRSSGVGQKHPSRDNYHHIIHTSVKTEDDLIPEMKTFSLPCNANPNPCTTKNLRGSGFSQVDISQDTYHHITHTAIQRKEGRRFKNTSYDKINAKEIKGNNPRLVSQSGASQMEVDANTHDNHLNNSSGANDEDRGNGVQIHQLHPVVCDDNEEVASSNIYHTLEAVTADEDDKDDILVDNDLYHTYRASGYMETLTDGVVSPDDECIMVDNDLYYSDDTN